MTNHEHYFYKESKGDEKVDLKERAIYQLPNGRELFVRVSNEEKAVLYNLSASESGEYTFDSDGRLFFNGRPTAWDIEDLSDTGRIATPDVTAVLAGAADAQSKIGH